MKNLMPLFFVNLIAILVFSCSSDSSETNVAAETTLVEENYTHSAYEMEVLDLLNEYRVAQNLPTLQLIGHISYVSSTHNDYMIALDTINHYGFEERKQNLVTVLDAFRVGENVACGFNSPQAVVNAWINSSGHKAVLEGPFTHFGLSVRSDANGKKYFTNIFVQK